VARCQNLLETTVSYLLCILLYLLTAWRHMTLFSLQHLLFTLRGYWHYAVYVA